MFLCDVRSFSSRHLNCMLSSSGAQFLAVITVVIKFLFCFSCSHSFFSFPINEKDGQCSVCRIEFNDK